MKNLSYFNTIFLLLLLAFGIKSNAQHKAWDAIVAATNEYNGSKLLWVFDERYIHAKNTKAITIDDSDSSYLHHSLDKLYTVETVIINDIEEQPLELIFERIAALPNLKHLVFTGPLFNRDKNLKRTLRIPQSIEKLQRIETIKFKLCRKLDIEDALEKISSLTNLKYLFIEFSDLKVLPDNLCKLRKLEGISLDNNNINNLPVCFRELSNLKTLSFTNEEKNNVESIFTTLARLPHLEYLLMPFSTFDSSFSGIGKLKNLKSLSSNNSIIKHPEKWFSDISKATKLSKLDASFSTMRFLPTTLGKMKHLETLSIVGIKTAKSVNDQRLKLLPSNFGSLKNLTTLNASSNHLADLPESFSKLQKLKNVNLEGNQFKGFPIQLAGVTSLQAINLSYNELEQIPDKIGSLINLERLILTMNKLTRLPYSFGKLNSLKYLDIVRNKLQSLPESFTNLKNLDTVWLAGNQLTQFPVNISSLTNLRLLSLNGNYLVSMPESLSKLEKLEVLDVSTNSLTELPGTFERLKNLKTFSAANNQLKSLPDSLGIGYALTSFDVSNTSAKFRTDVRTNKTDSSRLFFRNKFTSLPSFIPHNNNLEFLNLNNNPQLDSTKTIYWIQSIVSVKANVNASNTNIKFLPSSGWGKFNGTILNLGNNKINHLPPSFLEMPNMKSIQLNGNLLPAQLNTSFSSKGELALAMAEAGILPSFKLTKDLLDAAKKRADYYYYRNDFISTAKWHKQIEETDSVWANINLDSRQRGEAKYFTADYNGAIKYLSKALQQDTSTGFRIINVIRPSMYYISKSYLALKDTVKTYEYLSLLSNRFLNDEVGMLSEAVIFAHYFNDEVNAQRLQEKAYASYKRQKQTPGVQLSIMELLIISNKPEDASKFSDSIDVKTLSVAETFLYDYLKLTAEVLSKKSASKEIKLFTSKYDQSNFKMPTWSFSLYDLWITTMKADDEITITLEQLYKFLRQRFEGTKQDERIVPFFG